MNRLTALGVVAVLAVTACSPDPIEQYLTTMRQVTLTMQRDSISAMPDRDSITRDGVAAVNEARRAALAEIDALLPPSELAPEHRALELALGDLVAAADQMLADTAAQPPDRFSETIHTSVAVDEIALRVASACAAIEDRSIAMGYSVVLAC